MKVEEFRQYLIETSSSLTKAPLTIPLTLLKIFQDPNFKQKEMKEEEH